MGSNPADDDGLLRVIKIHSMTSFKGEVKLVVPCCKILWHVKDPYSMKEILSGQISGHFSPVSPALLLSVSAVTVIELWWVNHERFDSDGKAQQISNDHSV
jgi:hypothetical protein